MGYWKDKSGKKTELRLLQQDGSWLAYNDSTTPDGEHEKTSKGSHEHIEEALVSALHSTNLIVLLGSGASFAAKNSNGDSAPGMADLWDAVETSCLATFSGIVEKVTGQKPSDNSNKSKDIENLLSLCKITIELSKARSNNDDADGIEAFVKNAEQAILERVDFVSNKTDITAHLEFLRRLARRNPEKSRVRLFTTNYDMCIEEAAMQRRIVLIDGFSHSTEQRFNRDHFEHDIVRRTPQSTRADYIDSVFHLYKMHGSLDWRRKDGMVIRSKDDKLDPVLIYPRSSKYQESFATPYLDMFAAWQASLREPDTTLIIAGFGFADDHISAPIWAALESNLSLQLILCDPCFIPSTELACGELIEDKHLIDKTNTDLRPYHDKIIQLVKQGDNRVTILNGRFDDLADAMPTMIGKTDRQQLEARLEQIQKGAGNE